MKALVIGTGSVGRRHIGNLIALGADVVAFSHRGHDVAERLPGADVRLVSDVASAIAEHPDAVVVANSTEMHVETAISVARSGIPLFIEKPLGCSMDGVSELKSLVDSQNLVVEAGFMLRFHPNLRWIKDVVVQGQLGSLMSVRASVGQWLPSWRPGIDHRLSYSARVEKGGGVIFDLTHELDLVSWLIGQIVDVSAMTRKVDLLEIGSEAIAEISLRAADGVIAQVHLDYVRPGYGRSLEVIGTLGVIDWDYMAGTVTLSKADGTRRVVDRVPPAYERNAMFIAHMRHFLRRLEDDALAPGSSLDEAIDVLGIALACHRSSTERRCIDPREYGRRTAAGSVG